MGDPRSGDPADDRLDRRQLEHRGRDAHDDPDVPDRQPDAAQRGRRDRRRHRPGLAVGRRRARRCCTSVDRAPPTCCSSAASKPATTTAPCCTASTCISTRARWSRCSARTVRAESTLLKSISGIVEADRGAIVLDGRDITHAPPNEIAALGIVQMPGGQGVFGSLTVRENLELAGWTNRRDSEGVAVATAEVFRDVPGSRRSARLSRCEHVRRPAADAGAHDELRDATEGAADRRAVARPRTGRGRPAAAIVRRMADDGVTVVLANVDVRADRRRAGLLHGARHDHVRRTDQGVARTTRPAAVGVPRVGRRRRARRGTHRADRHRRTRPPRCSRSTSCR